MPAADISVPARTGTTASAVAAIAVAPTTDLTLSTVVRVGPICCNSLHANGHEAVSTDALTGV
jgi:hypothetical protein